VDELTVQAAVWRSQEALFSHGFLLRDYRFEDRALPVTVALWEDGTSSLRSHWEWIRRETASGRAVLVLDVSGDGPLAPHLFTGAGLHDLYGAIHKLATDLLWLDDDLVSLRTFDVLRALDMVAIWPALDAADIRCAAFDRRGVCGRLAALLDPRITRVESIDPFDYGPWVESRFYDVRGIHGAILPGVLRFFDLPELEQPTDLPRSAG
jgi:hypothetical protein